ncbi:MAG: SdrD B-like domain-containing protein, partial [Bacteroidota bacterium]
MSLLRQFGVHHCLSKPPFIAPTPEHIPLTRPRFWSQLVCWSLLLLALPSSAISTPTIHPEPSAHFGESFTGLGIYDYQWYARWRAKTTASPLVLLTSVGDYVWKDCDQDGIQDPGEAGIPNVPITLRGTDVLGNAVDELTFSGPTGSYAFTDLHPGLYTLEFGLPPGISGVAYTSLTPGADTLGSDADPLTGRTAAFRIENNKSISILDAGFIDMEAPVLLGVPADTTVTCGAIPLAPKRYVDILATDNWATDVTITFSESSTQGTNGPCSAYEYLIIRTWSADDGCGNSSAEVQLITVKDSAEPTFGQVPADITVDPARGELIPPPPNPAPSDNCDPNPQLHLIESDSPTGDCGLVRTRTWTVTDACGNQNAISQRITVRGTGNGGTARANGPLCTGDELRLFAEGGLLYHWTGPNNFSSDLQNPVLTAVGAQQAGIYSVLIDDGTCSSTIDVAVTISPALVVLPTIDPANCSAPGRIEVLVSGGTAPYTFDWQDLPGTDDPANRTDLVAGSYPLLVRDAGQCEWVETLVVVEDCPCTPPEVTDLLSRGSTCAEATGWAEVRTAGNPADYVYEWVPDLGTPNVANNRREALVAGVYTVKISDPLGVDCATEVSLVVGNVDASIVEDLTVSPASCALSNGSARLQPDYFTYRWTFDGTAASTRNDLAAGTYEVLVFDQSVPPCPNVILVEIPEENLLQLTAQVNQVPSCQMANGSVTIGVLGGSGNYAYSWGADARRDDLAAGVYTVEVSDLDRGCARRLTFALPSAVRGASIDAPTELLGSCAGVQDVQLDYDISFAAGFAFPADTFLVNATDTLNPAAPLAPGTYCLIVEDANGCLAGQHCFSVSEPAPLAVDLAIANQDCFRAGSIQLQVSGGVGPYRFNWSDLTGGGQSPDRDDLLAGTYRVTVRDANGCRQTLTDLVVANQCPTGCIEPVIRNVAVVEASCGAADGVIRLEMQGNPNQFHYRWTPDLGIGTAERKSNLPAGQYAVVITNIIDPSCSIRRDFLVQNADGPTVDIQVTQAATCQLANGAATLLPIAFDYRWCNGSDKFSATDLPSGTCYVTVTDPVTACSQVVAVEIPEGNPLRVQPQVLRQPDCGQANGRIELLVSGGSGAYALFWSDGGVGALRDNLAAGQYGITVTDPGGGDCQIEQSVVLTDAQSAAVRLRLDTAVPLVLDCAAGRDGKIDFTVDYPPTFAFPADTIISDGNGTYTNGELPAGNYCLLIRDAAACVAAEACFAIEEPEPMLLVATVRPVTCNDPGSIAVRVEGGRGNYQYDWAHLPGNANASILSSLAAGVYQLTVTDDRGCAAYARDLIVVDDCLACPNSATLRRVIPTNSSQTDCIQLEACFTRNLTNIVLSDADRNGQSPLGSWTLASSGCLDYHAGATPGADTICVIAQYGNLLDTTCMIYAVFDPPTVPALTDTLYLDTPEQTGVDTCLSLLELGGVFTDARILEAPRNATGSLELTAACLRYEPNAGVLGPGVDTMLVEVCNAAIPLCDTTVVVVSVSLGLQCTPFFAGPDTLDLFADDCDGEALFCLDSIPPFATQFYSIEVDQQPLAPPFVGCNPDTLIEYDLDRVLRLAPLGPYELVEWVVNADTFRLATFPSFAVLLDSMNVWDPLGNWERLGDRIVGGNLANQYGDLNVESPQVSIGDPIPLDLLIAAQGTQIAVDTGFHQLVLTLDSTGCSDTLWLDVACDLCPDYYAGPDSLLADSCAGTAPLCLDVELVNLPQFTIEDNGALFTGDFRPCAIDTSFQYVVFPLAIPGIYELVSWEVNGTNFTLPLFTTVAQLADSMRVWDPAGNWQLLGLVIVGGNPGSSYGALEVASSGNAPFNIELQLINDAVAILLSPGEHDIRVTDNRSICVDEFSVTVTCDSLVLPPPPLDTLLRVFEGETDTLCLEDLPVIDSFRNLCPDDSDGNVSVEVILGTNCIAYSGLELGLDTFCLEVCEGLLCDTVNWVIETLPLRDTIPLFVEVGRSDTFCIDTSVFHHPLDTFFNFCEGSAGVFVDVILVDNSFCVEYTGLTPGIDSACLVGCDTAGFCDTTILVLEAVRLQPEVIDTTVLLADFDTLCIDTSELPGEVDTFFNACSRNSGVFVDFVLDRDRICVVYEGRQLGTDTACLVYCDEFGICDSTTLIVTTIEGAVPLLPVAVRDSGLTTSATPVEIDILRNDTINGNLINILIIDPPLNGVASGMGFNLVYLPDPDFCDGVDSFSYAIENEVGRDTATVVVEVRCTDLKVYT